MYSVARLCPDQSSCRCVVNVVWLGLVCCTRLIWTLITVCSASSHLLLLEFDIPELRPQLMHWSLKYHGVERPNLLSLSCRLRFDCGMALFDTGMMDGFKGAANRWLFPWVVFSSVSVAQVLVGLRKQFINNFVFPTWACATDFNNNLIIQHYQIPVYRICFILNFFND